MKTVREKTNDLDNPEPKQQIQSRTKGNIRIRNSYTDIAKIQLKNLRVWNSALKEGCPSGAQHNEK